MTLARGGAAPRVPLFVRAGGVCFVLLAARGAAHARAYAMGDGRWRAAETIRIAKPSARSFRAACQ
ncbi:MULTISPECIES: hypothetical protein [pseudomallei group]|uniref:Uncharacterized protein n=4 Tax=pseudomallei group TaxID=111527 RepID=A2S1X4_BURM9|nr:MULTISPECIES: hypothetical protein [pseudomallei group]MCE2034438.1 hypothetical protein [Burkholderia pseudomallei CS]MCE2040436.1 hypothetical protein [Burkholderia pseudomallei CB]MCE2046636.1 hypothetical protein [Burkholderia pseudomallei OS]MCE2052677.1 hypothetical protein [Burkholderia pseudomallei OB]ABM99703.2 hypothetical protein BMA10229_2150 [Burkholderia mallei NCTC 10229]